MNETKAEKLRDATWEAIRVWRKSLDTFPRGGEAEAVDKAIADEIAYAKYQAGRSR